MQSRHFKSKRVQSEYVKAIFIVLGLFQTFEVEVNGAVLLFAVCILYFINTCTFKCYVVNLLFNHFKIICHGNTVNLYYFNFTFFFFLFTFNFNI